MASEPAPPPGATDLLAENDSAGRFLGWTFHQVTHCGQYSWMLPSGRYVTGGGSSHPEREDARAQLISVHEDPVSFGYQADDLQRT